MVRGVFLGSEIIEKFKIMTVGTEIEYYWNIEECQ